MPGSPARSVPTSSASASANLDATLAADLVCEEVSHGLNGAEADLAVLFVCGEHISEFAAISERVRRAIGPGWLIGMTCQTVIGVDEEYEGTGATSLMALSLPGATVRPFRYRDLPRSTSDDESMSHAVANAVHAEETTRGMIFLADPFSVPASNVLSLLAHAGKAVGHPVPVVGGFASSARQPGQNLLVHDEQLINAGGVGVVISGEIAFDTLVSQGCRPIGRPLIVTDVQRNVVRGLGGVKAAEALQEVVESLDPEDRGLLEKGLFVGVVIDEYKARFGRGDFLVRGVLGMDRDSGALAFGEVLRRGQTVQFHVRDAETASEDLQLLLDAQRLRRGPIGSLVFSCNGRGKDFFGTPHHDVRAVQRALGGESKPMPIAGCFAAGEFGPVGDRSFIHGHSVSLAMFRGVDEPIVGV